MKQLIIGIVLAVCLIGCAENPKFSINEDDTAETYSNNPIFTKIKVSIIIDGKDDNVDMFEYQFTSRPISVFGIETSDLNVIGGVVTPAVNAGEKGISIILTMEGKESFDKLEKRLNELKELTCTKVYRGNYPSSFDCNIEQQPGRIKIGLYYNPFADIASLMYIKY